jgi:predicted O-methyltransferase YrrM
MISFAKRYAIALAGSAYAFTLGVRDRRHRALIHDLATHFGYDDHPRRELRTVAVDAITSSATTVAIAEPYGADGNVSLLELLTLCRLVKERRPRAIFEIGTFDGRTTLNLAQNAPPDATVHTLDLPPTEAARFALSADDRKYVDKPSSGSRFARTPLASRIVQLWGDSAAFDFASYSADFVFVDGAHSYDYVMNDSRVALQLLGAMPGTIVWHDYGVWPGVTLALNELAKREPALSNLSAVEGTTLVVAQVG